MSQNTSQRVKYNSHATRLRLVSYLFYFYKMLRLHTNATYENFVGSPNRTCKKGFIGDGTTKCTGDLTTDNEMIIL